MIRMGHNPSMDTDKKMETAAFAAGCFWGVEDAFRNVPGVIRAVSGYAGGTAESPTYEAVCTGATGHAETVEVVFDPNGTSYEKLLEVFWDIHNPTTPDRQGPDIGNQYRSVIFFYSEAQRRAALRSKEHLERSGRFKDRVVTQILPAPKFWPAEEYHQRYFETHGRACRI